MHVKKKGPTSACMSTDMGTLHLSIIAWKPRLSYSRSMGVSIIPTFVRPLMSKIYIDSLFKFLPKLGHKMTDSKLGAQ